MARKDKHSDKPFEIPKALLEQLDECTKGFFLLTVNENGDFDMFQSYSDTVTELGVTNCLNVHFNAMQEVVKQQALARMMEITGDGLDDLEDGEEPEDKDPSDDGFIG